MENKKTKTKQTPYIYIYIVQSEWAPAASLTSLPGQLGDTATSHLLITASTCSQCSCGLVRRLFPASLWCLVLSSLTTLWCKSSIYVFGCLCFSPPVFTSLLLLPCLTSTQLTDSHLKDSWIATFAQVMTLPAFWSPAWYLTLAWQFMSYRNG